MLAALKITFCRAEGEKGVVRQTINIKANNQKIAMIYLYVISAMKRL